MTKKFIEDCLKLREENPLIHCISNYVAMNYNANALLAVGASPIMSFRKEEMLELVSSCLALYVNMGCPDEALVEAAELAVMSASLLGKPWVLDPVGAGATSLRTDIALDLLKRRPAIVRGNAAEIIALDTAARGVEGYASEEGEPLENDAEIGNGVDSSSDSMQALDAAKRLAVAAGTVVVVSGGTDIITDGETVLTVANGDPRMQKITGTGCTVSALCAAFAAVNEDALSAAWEAMALMGVAGERAAAMTKGTASMQNAIIDELSTFDPEEYASLIRC